MTKPKTLFMKLLVCGIASFLALPLALAADESDQPASPLVIEQEPAVLDAADAAIVDPGIPDLNLTPASAAAPGQQPDSSAQSEQVSLLALIGKGGVVGYLIILISVVALALIIDYQLTIRRSRILPAADISRLRQLIEADQLGNLDQLEGKGNSYLTRVTAAGLREANVGYGAMIKAMEDSSEALAAGIARKTEHLNVIGALSPMLGLLGTVLGMLQVFNEIAITPGAIEPRQLAEGIFQALVTTCLGLIVAIPALYSYAIFRNRVDELTGEAALTAERLIAPFKTAAGDHPADSAS